MECEKYERFSIYIHPNHPLVIDKLRREKRVCAYLKELIFADMYAHDSLITKAKVAGLKPESDSYKTYRASIRVKPEEESDILTHLQSKVSRRGIPNANSYVCSLVYHDLGCHDLALEVNTKKAPEPKVESKQQRGGKKDHVNFVVKIPPEHKLVLSKLERVGYNSDYVKSLIEEWAYDNEKLINRLPEPNLPMNPPCSYYRKTHGCTLILSYKPEEEDEEIIRFLINDIERNGLLTPFICYLIYHDIGRHDLAVLENRYI